VKALPTGGYFVKRRGRSPALVYLLANGGSVVYRSGSRPAYVAPR
jgi:hypothetical protein